jgi:hypothetical protein
MLELEKRAMMKERAREFTKSQKLRILHHIGAVGGGSGASREFTKGRKMTGE